MNRHRFRRLILDRRKFVRRQKDVPRVPDRRHWIRRRVDRLNP